VTHYFTIDAANEVLPELRGILEALRGERSELIRHRDEVLELQAAAAADDAGGGSDAGGPRRRRSREATRAAAELRVLRLRMQGVIDQMQAGVARIDELGVVLRDISVGLVDFPALAAGRQVSLCWRLDDTEGVAWWHEMDAGFAGRQALSDLR
jgi:hypothetical protein